MQRNLVSPRQKKRLLDGSGLLSITGLVVLLAVGLQSVQGHTHTHTAEDHGYENFTCEVRDSDWALVSCAGSATHM